MPHHVFELIFRHLKKDFKGDYVEARPSFKCNIQLTEGGKPEERAALIHIIRSFMDYYKIEKGEL